MELPLAGIRILELATYVGAPGGTMMLSDMGAEVIKVESAIGDDIRRLDSNAYLKNESKYHQAINRNKRGVVIDITKPEGLKLVCDLAAHSDVFIEAFRPGMADKLGVGYEELSKVNPRLIYVSMSAFGQTGPLGQKPGYDLIVQGFTGCMRRSPIDGNPALNPVLVADSSTPMLVAYGIMLALFVRERTGIGQKVETSLLAGALSMQAAGFVRVKNDPTPPRRTPKHMQRPMATYRSFATTDGYVNVGALSNRVWQRLCQATGLESLLQDSRFENQAKRFENNRFLSPLFEEVFKLKSAKEWLQILDEAGVPCGPVNNLTDLFDDQHVLENELVVEIEHSTIGPVQMLGLPVKLSKTPGKVRCPAPLLGQHTDEVMAELGLSPATIADLRQRQIIA